MSIQFRSRIKPAIDYTNDLNAFGTCCSLNESPRAESFYGCFASGGQFISEPWNGTPDGQCPSTDTRLGCCCACSYVSDTEYDLLEPYPPTTPYLLSGTQSNVSKCECDRLKGKWTDEVCPTLDDNNWKRYCVSGTQESNEIDVRYPKSCCHLGFDSETGWPIGVTCSDVCTYGQCAALGTSEYASIYDDTTRCKVPLREGGGVAACSNPFKVSLMATKTNLYENFNMGSCYTLEEVNGNLDYTCALTPISMCGGYWVQEADADIAYCTTEYRPTNPTKINGKYQAQTMSQSSFDSLGLTSGNPFQGGIYIGIFEPTPNNSTSSLIYSNIDFGRATETRFYGDGTGNVNHKKWAIIVAKYVYLNSFLESTESDVNYPTSMWDGYYNIYGKENEFNGINTKIVNEIKGTVIEGFNDWYIPSIYELGLYALSIHNKKVSSDIGILLSSSMFSSNKINSTTNKTKLVNNSSFVYGQQCQDLRNQPIYNHKVGLVDKIEKSYLRLFRKIVIEG